MKGKTFVLAGALGVAFATGAAFGPLGPATAGHATAVLAGDLNGRSEVRNDATDQRIVGDPDGRGEVYVFGIDNDNPADRTLCYVLSVDGIATATAAHIHRGGAGVAGPVVASLGAPGDGNAADCLNETETGKFPGQQPGIVAEILSHPEQFYVNVHNADYPGGAIRGQLAGER